MTIDRPADEVWGVLGDFGDLSWIPGVTWLQRDGDLRVFQLGASVVRHRLVQRDEAARSYTYALAGDPAADPGERAPTTQATISVVAAGPMASTVTWSSETDDRKGSSEGLQAFFQRILDHLKDQLEHGAATPDSAGGTR
jgi:Polyketide cyclase / dehydrase and lipid transport